MDIIDIIKNLTNQKEMKHGYKQIKSKKLMVALEAKQEEHISKKQKLLAEMKLHHTQLTLAEMAT